MKECQKCKIVQEVSNFYKRTRSKDGLQCICKTCNAVHRNSQYHKNHEHELKKLSDYNNRESSKIRRINFQLRKLYNVDLDFYNTKLLSQDNRCAICKTHESEFKTRLSLDHDHESGKIRGILCTNCNVNVGFLEKGKSRKIQLIEETLEYINEHKEDNA